MTRTISGKAAAVAGALAGLALAGPPAAAEMADVAKAKAEGKVVLYSANRSNIVDAQAALFEKKYGIKVEALRLGNQKLAQRVVVELQAGNIGADLIHCLCIALAEDLHRQGHIAAFKTPDFDKVPAELKDPQGYWTANRVTVVAMAYNKNRLKEAPGSWWELADPKHAGKTTMGDANYGSLPVALAEALSAKFGWDIFERIGKNKPLVFQTNVQSVQWIATGERLMGPITDYDAAAAIGKGEPIALAYPKEGVIAVPGITVVMAAAKRPNAARLFAEWLLSDEGQKSYVDGQQYGARTDVPSPSGLKGLGELKILPINFERIEKEEDQIKQRYMKAIAGQ